MCSQPMGSLWPPKCGSEKVSKSSEGSVPTAQSQVSLSGGSHTCASAVAQGLILQDL